MRAEEPALSLSKGPMQLAAIEALPKIAQVLRFAQDDKPYLRNRSTTARPPHLEATRELR